MHDAVSRSIAEIGLKKTKRFLAEQNANYGDEFVLTTNGMGINEVLKDFHKSHLSMWRNNRLFVQIWKIKNEPIKMTFTRTQLDDKGRFKDGILWDQIQHAKNSVEWGKYKECDFIEFYPAQSNLVYTHNVRHIYLFEPPFVLTSKDFAV